MSARYGPPFRLYLVTDPKTGRRVQLSDRERAEELAARLAAKTRVAADSLIAPSRYWYTNRYTGSRRTIRVNTKCPTKHQAQNWIDERVRDVGAGTLEPRQQRFAAAVDAWIEEKRVARYAEKTIVDQRSVVSFWKKVLGPLDVSDVTPDDILDYFSKRESGQLSTRKKKPVPGGAGDAAGSPKGAEGRKKKGKEEKQPPGVRVLQKDRILLGSFFRWARKRGLCTVNPVEFAPTFRAEEKEPRALTAEEVGRLLVACREPYQSVSRRITYRAFERPETYYPPPHLYGVVLFGIHSLLRVGNILSLKWKDLDLERRVIRIEARRMKTRRETAIPMTDTLVKYCESLPRGEPDAPIFGVRIDSVKRSFRSACERAKLEGITFHNLRKTGATILIDAGIPISVVQSIGGWKTPDVLLKHYAATTQAAKERALDVLDSLGG